MYIYIYYICVKYGVELNSRVLVFMVFEIFLESVVITPRKKKKKKRGVKKKKKKKTYQSLNILLIFYSLTKLVRPNIFSNLLLLFLLYLVFLLSQSI